MAFPLFRTGNGISYRMKSFCLAEAVARTREECAVLFRVMNDKEDAGIFHLCEFSVCIAKLVDVSVLGRWGRRVIVFAAMLQIRVRVGENIYHQARE